MSKTVIAKYAVGGKNFEIFVNSDQAYEYISGKRSDPLAALEVDEIFSDANKGERQSAEAVKKAFGTEDRAKIVETILKKGNVPVTTEQRNKMLEEKRKQIITIIATNSIDPRTGAPHTAQRIENAMKEVRVQIDPFKNATEQVDSVVKQLSVRLPIKFATARMDVIIPAEYANRCYGLLKQYGLKSEKWLDNGSLNAEVEFPAGLQGEFFEKLNSFTKGNAIAKKIGS
jgi:ribosome maturation protein SDO1